MAGANLEPATLSGAALVIIDAQREYVDGKLPLTGVGPAMEAIGTLLSRARAANATVVHILHRGKAGGAFDPDGDGYQPADQAAPVEGVLRVDDAIEAVKGADLLLIATEWPEFQSVDLMRVRDEMATPRIVDARNMLDPDAVRNLGMEYEGIGR